jgi:hypothetical protein
MFVDVYPRFTAVSTQLRQGSDVDCHQRELTLIRRGFSPCRADMPSTRGAMSDFNFIFACSHRQLTASQTTPIEDSKTQDRDTAPPGHHRAKWPRKLSAPWIPKLCTPPTQRTERPGAVQEASPNSRAWLLPRHQVARSTIASASA